MSLQPSVAYTSLGSGPNTVEFWLDLLCPFSSKCTAFLHRYLVPQVLPGGKYHGKFRILIRPYPQPWHPQGGWSALSTFSFGRAFASPGNPYGGDERLWFEYYAAVAAAISEFKDDVIENITPTQYYAKLHAIGGEVVVANAEKLGLKNITSKEAIVQAFAEEQAPKLNAHGFKSNENQNDSKYFVKLGRQNGVHVTLSVLFNGIYDAAPQSSWGEAEWDDYLAKKGI